MRIPAADQLSVAIACGGTGGHLFPGLAVAGQLASRGVGVTLLISPKEIDQVAVQAAEGMKVVTLPAVGLTRGGALAFLKGFLRSYRAASALFRQHPPHAVLAMGGFTSAPPVLAAKRLHAATFLHESNSIPGRANRWLAWVVDRAFIGFPEAAQRLHNRAVSVTGTPVRPNFQPQDPAACRGELGLDPARPVVLVMGGSQGAHAINELVVRSLPLLAKAGPDWQWLHLAGSNDVEPLKQAYRSAGVVARVYPFWAEMAGAMGAATASISRAGASSLAELAAMRLPAVLIPFPAATDNHQYHNASAFAQSGAARLLSQPAATPEELVRLVSELVLQEEARARIQASLAGWHTPRAADQIARAILDSVNARSRRSSGLAPGAGPRPPVDPRASCSTALGRLLSAAPGAAFLRRRVG